MIKAGNIFRCFVEALTDTINHDGVEHAGYLSYVSLLAICPFLILFTTLVGWIGDAEMTNSLINTILHNLPSDAARALSPRVRELSSGPPEGLLPIAFIAAIWTSSSAVEGMRTVLNRAYRVTNPPAYWFRRGLSIIQFLLFTALLLAAVSVQVFAPIAIDFIQGALKIDLGITALIKIIGASFIGIVFFIVISLFYYLLPNIKQRLRHVIPGSLLVALLWVMAASLFSAYLSNFDQVNIVYGSLEGIIVTLVFFYIMSLIFIYGAEFNYRLDKVLGVPLVEKEHYENK